MKGGVSAAMARPQRPDRGRPGFDHGAGDDPPPPFRDPALHAVARTADASPPDVPRCARGTRAGPAPSRRREPRSRRGPNAPLTKTTSSVAEATRVRARDQPVSYNLRWRHRFALATGRWGQAADVVAPWPERYRGDLRAVSKAESIAAFRRARARPVPARTSDAHTVTVPIRPDG